MNPDIFNELSEHIAITINSCHKIFHDESYSEHKSHRDYDYWLILKGGMRINTQNSIYHVTKGDSVLHYPHKAYSAFIDPSGCEFIYIHFEYSLGENFRILEGYDFSGIVSAKSLGTKTTLLSDAYNVYRNNQTMSAIMLKGTFLIMLSGFFNACLENLDFQSFDTVLMKDKKAAFVASLAPVLSYIADNLHMSISISDLSKEANLSEKYFIKHFKEAVGVSPGRYITQLKMNRARDLLYRQELSIKEISGMLGYSDQYVFSKAFKKHYKTAPSKFI